MCITLDLPGSPLITRAEQLREVLGHEPQWLPGAELLAGEDICLCPIDLEAVAAELGYQLTWMNAAQHAVAIRRCDA